MKMLKSLSRSLSLTAADAASLAKAAILSRRPHIAVKTDKNRVVVILGNGPSLRPLLDSSSPWLARHTKMAVNFFANTPDFFITRPELYILADPHFFDAIDSDPNVKRLWQNLLKADWPITLFVPAVRLSQVRALTDRSPISLSTFNLTPLEGHKALTHSMADLGLGMPRPRNVMIAAIMVALTAGYGKIYLAGADHSWSKTLDVDEQNRVVSVQPHFYKDSDSEHKRVSTEYAGYHLHDILRSLTVAFESYHHIAAYAAHRGAEIINITPGSMIDAFPRQTVDQRQSLSKG